MSDTIKRPGSPFDDHELLQRKLSGTFMTRQGMVWPPRSVLAEADDDPISSYEQKVIDYAERWALIMQTFFVFHNDDSPLGLNLDWLYAKSAAEAAGRSSHDENVHWDAISLLSNHWEHGDKLRNWLGLDQDDSDGPDDHEEPMLKAS